MRASTRCIAILLALGAAGSAAQGEIVYDNLATPTAAYSGVTLEQGDQVTLGGTARMLTCFTLPLVSGEYGSSSARLRLSLYRNDGPDGAPRTLLYRNGEFDVTYSYGTTTFAELSLPDVLVPDTFTWTIAPVSTAGWYPDLPWYDPPTIGSSGDFFWQYWVGIWRTVNIFPWVNDNFGARFEAVPEPGRALLPAAVLGAWAARRRR
jgi:hypothetical protein